MARWCFMLLIVLAVVTQGITARNVPSETKNTVNLTDQKKGDVGLADQKNVFTFGGLGGYSGFDNNGQPIGGGFIGSGIGNNNGIGGIGAGYGFGGPGAAAGGIGTIGGLANGFAGLPALGGGGIGGGGPGAGIDAAPLP
ncbi:hypothetical protein L1987_50622 [Smallanthus sonchifolius]|uniref:Uncharacterized protein n=1 Tax=Smallanthus sonchifolius TaxID=185202 RepID=A0ACB9EN50_9ASTR|nr:hypothetical protein L1987_50622 [Smallanthus sonchifolius]